MRSILVLNAKGGSGKTTVATNLAGYYASEGAKVTLADFDPQGSSIDWLRQRPDTVAKIAGVEAHAKGLRVPRSTEVLVMDAPSRTHDDQLVALLRRAQTVVIPVVPSPVDIRAAERFFGELGEVRDRVKKDVKIATVASRVREGGRTTECSNTSSMKLSCPRADDFRF